jgi:CRISPR-associated protein Cmr6
MEHEQDKYGLIGRWFGAAKGIDQAMPEGAGNLIFFDALPTAPVLLSCDIMTPHMNKWYEKGGDIGAQDYATTAPADWHNPGPCRPGRQENTHLPCLRRARPVMD